jgi:hypothetical protein
MRRSKYANQYLKDILFEMNWNEVKRKWKRLFVTSVAMSLTDVTQSSDIAHHLGLKNPQFSEAGFASCTLKRAHYTTFFPLITFEEIGRFREFSVCKIGICVKFQSEPDHIPESQSPVNFSLILLSSSCSWFSFSPVSHISKHALFKIKITINRVLRCTPKAKYIFVDDRKCKDRHSNLRLGLVSYGGNVQKRTTLLLCICKHLLIYLFLLLLFLFSFCAFSIIKSQYPF